MRTSDPAIQHRRGIRGGGARAAFMAAWGPPPFFASGRALRGLPGGRRVQKQCLSEKICKSAYFGY